MLEGIPMSPDGSFIIDQTNASYLDDDNKHQTCGIQYWHKFIVKNCVSFDEETVLRTIVETVYPEDLIPVKITKEDQDVSFLARKCGPAIQKLCTLQLTVTVEDKPVLLNIHINHTLISDYKINMKPKLIEVMEQKHDREKNHLDLSNFHRHPDLCQLFFCPLYHPKILSYILSIIKSFELVSLSLSNNHIKNIKSLETLYFFSRLTTLDLSNNDIDDRNSLQVLQQLDITHLILSGNPICANYSSPSSYIRDIVSFTPKLSKLDGFAVNRLTNTCWNPVYLCQERGRPIVEQLIKHYFTLYDNERQILADMYAENAVFSLTLNFGDMSSSELEQGLKCYFNQSRNLLNSPEVRSVALKRGADDIINCLQSLPQTKHDVSSFAVDLIHLTKECCLIKVSGLLSETESNRIYHFDRTFFMYSVAPDEYQIVNEMYNLRSSTEYEKSIFKATQSSEHKSPCFNYGERQKLVNLLSEITKMNKDYSQKCLEDVNWNIKRGLQVFLELYTTFKIPPDAFEILDNK